jgi:hypothetical protein
MSISLTQDCPGSASERHVTVPAVVGGAQVRDGIERVSLAEAGGQEGMAVTEWVTGPSLHSLTEGAS